MSPALCVTEIPLGTWTPLCPPSPFLEYAPDINEHGNLRSVVDWTLVNCHCMVCLMPRGIANLLCEFTNYKLECSVFTCMTELPHGMCQQSWRTYFPVRYIYRSSPLAWIIQSGIAWHLWNVEVLCNRVLASFSVVLHQGGTQKYVIEFRFVCTDRSCEWNDNSPNWRYFGSTTDSELAIISSYSVYHPKMKCPPENFSEAVQVKLTISMAPLR